MDNSSCTSGLDKRAVDRIFTRLLVRYGAPWLRLWDGIEIDAVKADWSRELGGMSFDAILYALDNLPDERPPATAAVFRKLAVNRPQYFTALTDDRKADPVRVKQILGGLKVTGSGDTHAWARALQQREEAGEKLSPTQKIAWRQALKRD